MTVVELLRGVFQNSLARADFLQLREEVPRGSLSVEGEERRREWKEHTVRRSATRVRGWDALSCRENKKKYLIVKSKKTRYQNGHYICAEQSLTLN